MDGKADIHPHSSHLSTFVGEFLAVSGSGPQVGQTVTVAGLFIPADDHFAWLSLPIPCSASVGVGVGASGVIPEVWDCQLSECRILLQSTSVFPRIGTRKWLEVRNLQGLPACAND